MTSVVQAPTIQAPAVPMAVVTPGRDLRLDLFRGLALWLIFLDHIPNNILAWFTIRSDERMSRRLPDEYHCAAGAPPLRPANH